MRRLESGPLFAGHTIFREFRKMNPDFAGLAGLLLVLAAQPVSKLLCLAVILALVLALRA